MMDSLQIAFTTADEIQQLQLSRLKALLQHVAQHSPFYRRLFSEHSIDITSIKSLGDLTMIPVTTKNDLQNFNFDFLCIDRRDIIEYTSTSGTLGKPVTIALSASDIQRLGYNEAASFTCADGNKADLYQLMLTMDRQFMAGLAYYEGIRKLGAGIIRVGPGFPGMQWETIARLKPTTIVGVPSFVIKLLEYAKEHRIECNQTSVRKMICIGESIRHADLQPNVLAKKITDTWNIILYSTYASTEMQTAFTECRHGVGGHLLPDLLLVEILDELNQPVKPGESGEVTITTLGVEAMPLIRYKTGDIAQLHDAKCACGRTSPRLGPIQGRKQHMLKLKGTTLYPPAVFDILNQESKIRDYAIEALTGPLGTDELKIYAVADPSEHNALRQQLTAAFKSRLRVLPDIVFIEQHALEKLNGTVQNRKIQRFIDSRNHLDKW